jgi:hypothetical protein
MSTPPISTPPLKPPLIVNERGDIDIFESINAAERYLEPDDVDVILITDPRLAQRYRLT